VLNGSEERIVNKRLFGSVAAAAVIASAALSPAHAEGDSWEVPLRGAYLDPANKSDAIPGLAPANAIHIDAKWIPDLDFEYYFTPHWSSELVKLGPDVKLAGAGKVTTVHIDPYLFGIGMGYRFGGSR
jgi:outer membrane protein